MKTVSIFLTVLVVARASPTLKEQERVQNEWKALELENNMPNLGEELKSIIDSPELKIPAGFTSVTEEKKCQPCVCGTTSQHQSVRIAGGNNVSNISQYPWTAQLEYANKFVCTGSLINSRYVLTSAKCVSFAPVEDMKKHLSVRFLQLHIGNKPESKKPINSTVDRIIIHEGFKPKSGNLVANDIALLRLHQKVELKESSVSPVCLPIEGKTYTGVAGVVIGWGATNDKKPPSPSPVLQEVQVPIVANIECKKMYGDHGLADIITPNVVCAGIPNEGKGFCMGDGGSPLMVLNNFFYHLVGIASARIGNCKNKLAPDLYTKVDRYINWVKNNTKDACYCSQ